jgi:hypothetical protein
MAKKAKITKPTGGHTPVSNLRTEAAQVVEKPTSTPPSEGVNPKTLRPREEVVLVNCQLWVGRTKANLGLL